jgi:cell division septal protein FtsQ
VRVTSTASAALVAVAAPAGAVVWVLHSQRFALREIEVDNTQDGAVSRSWVRSALEPLEGRNLPALDLAEVEGRLRGHPWIGAIETHKELPRRLHVSYREKVPVALLQTGTTLYYLDGEGQVIAPVEPATDASAAPAAELFFVRVSAALRDDLSDSSARALALAEEIKRVDAQWYSGLSEVEVLNDEDCRVVTAALPFPVLLRRGNVESGAQRMRSLLPEIRRRYAAVQEVDLRSARRVVLQPAPQVPSTINASAEQVPTA